MERLKNLSFDFDDIVELAAMLCRAPTSVILKRDPETDAISTVARHGFINDFINEPPPERLMQPHETFVIYRDVQNDHRLQGHQVRTMVPKIKTLMAVQLTNAGVKGHMLLGIHNAPQDFFESDVEFSRFVKFVMMLQGQFDDVKEEDLVESYYPATAKVLHAAESPVLPLQPPAIAKPMDPAAIFLFETLSHKQTLHVRNGASYISLRAWRKPIKDHQVAALAAAKLFPPDDFIDQVADELAASAKHHYGAHTFATVVPVPGGSSATKSSLSEKLAARVAQKLKLPVQYALSPQSVAKGKSHPSKSAKLRPYELQEGVKGSALLIDDVATSGRHIELAQSAIRESGHDCFALSWIGP
jgi:hypothetical protein